MSFLVLGLRIWERMFGWWSGCADLVEDGHSLLQF